MDDSFQGFVGLENAALIIGDHNGVLFNSNKGDVDADTFMLVASASKWVTSMTIMKLVEQGVMSLEDHPQDYFAWWTADVGDKRSRVTLAQVGHTLLLA